MTGEDGLSAGSCVASDLCFPLFGLDDRHVSAEGRLVGFLGFTDLGGILPRGGTTKYVYDPRALSYAWSSNICMMCVPCI
jgi:hypothetical protein